MARIFFMRPVALKLAFICLLLFNTHLAFANRVSMKPNAVFPHDRLAQQMAEAAARGDVDRMKELQQKGASVKAKGERDITLPHFALYAKDPSALTWLVEQGADPVSRLPNDATVPHYAVGKFDAQRRPTAAWIEPLLKAGVSPDLRGSGAGSTLVLEATLFSNVPAVRALKAAGANLNLMSSPLEGTAIHLALTGGRLGLAAELADLGVDPRIRQQMGPDLLDAVEFYCGKGPLRSRSPEAKAGFDQMVIAFRKWGLEFPCGF